VGGGGVEGGKTKVGNQTANAAFDHKSKTEMTFPCTMGGKVKYWGGGKKLMLMARDKGKKGPMAIRSGHHNQY